MIRPFKAAAAAAVLACLGAAASVAVARPIDGARPSFCDRHPTHWKCDTTTTTTAPPTTTTSPPITTEPPPTTTEPPPTTTAPDPPPAPSSFIRGHSSHTLATSDLAQLKSAARLDAYRDDALFPSGTGPITDWSRLDSIFRNLSNTGYSTFLVIGDYGSTDPTVYSDRMRQVAQRYGPTGSYWTANPGLTPVGLMLEVWNEPWLNGVTAAQAAAMTAATVQKVHAVDPSILVGPNIDGAGTTVTFTDQFIAAYPAGAPLPDFISSHPYGIAACGTGTSCPDGQQFRFDRILLMRDHAAARGWMLPFLASEWGFPSPWDVTEAQQAQYARDGFEKLKTWGALGLFYYTGDRSCVKPGGDATNCGREGQYGIRYSDGSNRPAVAAIGAAQT